MKKIIHYLFFVVFLSGGQTFSQSNRAPERDTVSYYNMTLEQLMNVEVTVASHTALTARESPGIVTILTAEEIRKSGARDVMEVLKMVPGFDFGVDVEGVVGISVRGNWAHEGKVLMLLDGHEMNEELYSTLQFGAHYPVDQIKRIEIIRGPGSAIYGGNAEYAVINIVSMSQQDFDGIQCDVYAGQMSKTFAQRQFSMAGGKSIGKSFFGFSTNQINGNRSDQEFRDNYGNGYDMTHASPIHTSQYNVTFRHRGFALSGFIDQYHLKQQDGYDNVLSKPYPTDFDSYHLLSTYEWKPNEKLTITPGLRYKNEEPWRFKEESVNNEFKPYFVRVEKQEYFMTADYKASNALNFQAGTEYYTQQANQQIDSFSFRRGGKEFYVRNGSVYLQTVYKNRFANLTIGSRFNYNDAYSSSFVPRFGLTRVRDLWHVKILYSKAFRSPSIENINSGIGIQPEKTVVAELETGYQLSAHSYLTANIYDISTRDVIIYYYEENNEDAYKNEGKIGTRGVELEYKLKGRFGYLNANYAFYSSKGISGGSAYSVAGHPALMLGFPAHRINVQGNLRMCETINISPSFSVQSIRYSTFTEPIDSDSKLKKFDPALYANLVLNFENLPARGINFQLGCYNLFDEAASFIQPYSSNHAPLPGASREFRFRISYNFSRP